MAYVKKKENTKQEIAYKKIKEAILNNELKPETMLIEDKLCGMLGFSKTPIREALRRLTSEGFVESIPETGTFVTGISIDQVIQLYDVREVLEGLAARLCALRSEDAVITQLRNLIIELEKDLNENLYASSVEFDLKFHDVVIKGGQNKKLKTFTRTMIQQIHRFASTTKDDPERLRVSYEEHKKIYDAICNGDADSAERLMREHIRSVKIYHVNRNLLFND